MHKGWEYFGAIGRVCTLQCIVSISGVLRIGSGFLPLERGTFIRIEWRQNGSSCFRHRRRGLDRSAPCHFNIQRRGKILSIKACGTSTCRGDDTYGEHISEGRLLMLKPFGNAHFYSGLFKRYPLQWFNKSKREKTVSTQINKYSQTLGFRGGIRVNLRPAGRVG